MSILDYCFAFLARSCSLLLFATKVEVLLNCVLLFLMFLSPGMTQFNVLF